MHCSCHLTGAHDDNQRFRCPRYGVTFFGTGGVPGAAWLGEAGASVADGGDIRSSITGD